MLTHLEICDPDSFYVYEAWEKLGDLSDEECERMAEKIAKRAFGRGDDE